MREAVRFWSQGRAAVLGVRRWICFDRSRKFFNCRRRSFALAPLSVVHSAWMTRWTSRSQRWDNSACICFVSRAFFDFFIADSILPRRSHQGDQADALVLDPMTLRLVLTPLASAVHAAARRSSKLVPTREEASAEACCARVSAAHA